MEVDKNLDDFQDLSGILFHMKKFRIRIVYKDYYNSNFSVEKKYDKIFKEHAKVSAEFYKYDKKRDKYFKIVKSSCHGSKKYMRYEEKYHGAIYAKTYFYLVKERYYSEMKHLNKTINKSKKNKKKIDFINELIPIC
ncbi:hypothetical protein QLL95_gp0586 [Cotonvirus japonicus]|uniref:Uncharacterized protein n=1 Tax=Cotonvirus japonicus TaxID=2811091 RepID=A0ABM7NTY6_9VIRU|nr:hypothetical protein QLL95_gp0586 [Cotonvirus japonicus]BCS83537.1 hypothetical protein [Cotonvirus japonicus]